MEKTVDMISKALGSFTGSEIAVSRTDASEKLSPFLASAFQLYRVRFLGESLLVAAPAEPDDGFAAIRKRLAALEGATGERVALFSNVLSPAQKRALIDSRTGFVCADGNTYLPELGLSIQDALQRRKSLPRRFSPSEQLCFLCCLYSSGEGILQADACAATGLSAGSVSRAFSTFSDAGMLEYEVGGETGRLRTYRIPDKTSFFERGMAVFGDPIREVVLADGIPPGAALIESGMSALSRHSDLNPPPRRVLAMSPEQGALLNRSPDEPEAGWGCEVQVLRYDPAIFAVDGCVDPVTMLATLQDDDERIRIAARQAMEGYEWYLD